MGTQKTMNTNQTENIIGYPITTKNRKACVEEIYSWILTGEKNKYFVCANPHSLELAEYDRIFKDAILNADMITPDGSGIVIASKMLKGLITYKVSGSGIFRGLSRKLNECKKYKYFFLGSTEEILAQLKNKMAETYPDIEVAGVYSPPFKTEFSDDDNIKMIEAVNKARPDVLWVGMTAPKQEKWIYHNRGQLDVKFIGPVGAVFDFFTGNVERSHPLFIKTGLEWLPRLIKQPLRLWRRMFLSAPKFMLKVFRQKFKLIAID